MTEAVILGGHAEDGSYSGLVPECGHVVDHVHGGAEEDPPVWAGNEPAMQ